jgi:4a-hydroxytetrahydrobiopterin dehydratase
MKQQILPIDFDFQKNLPLWQVSEDRRSIRRQFQFEDFGQAFQFMTLCAGYAEDIDHHPDWSNSWNKVAVSLSTHSVGGITLLDIQMAQKMDHLAEQVR